LLATISFSVLGQMDNNLLKLHSYSIGKLWRFHASDLEGSTAALGGTLDSGASQRYALNTTRARN
jgi:hypothetical protein